MRGIHFIGCIKGTKWGFQLKKILIIATLSIFVIAGIGYAGGSNSVSVTATVVSNGSCSFTTSTSALNFGNLDPSNPVDVTRTTSVLFRCFRWFIFPVTFFIGDDDGLYEIGTNANRMRHTTMTTEYLPYNFTLTPQSGTVTGNLANHTLTITGTVRGVDYQDATMGNYSDRVIVSIEP